MLTSSSFKITKITLDFLFLLVHFFFALLFFDYFSSHVSFFFDWDTSQNISSSLLLRLLNDQLVNRTSAPHSLSSLFGIKDGGWSINWSKIKEERVRERTERRERKNLKKNKFWDGHAIERRIIERKKLDLRLLLNPLNMFVGRIGNFIICLS